MKTARQRNATAMHRRDQRRQQIRDLLTARELLTVLTLLVSLIVTYSLWKTAGRAEEAGLQRGFNYRVREVTDRVEQRLLVYRQVLRATVGLFDVAGTVDRAGFHDYVAALQLSQTYPGIQGIGFAVVVPPAQLQQHVADIRSQGFPDYRIKPPGPRDIYTSVVYLEPFSGRNLRAFGYDMYSEPNRRAAMAQARDTGQAAATGPVTLVQETGEQVQAGFLMYLPVYRRDAPHDTVQERQHNLRGWVYAPFRMNDFMRGLQDEQSESLDIEIFDQDSDGALVRIYDADGALDARDPKLEMHLTRTIPVANRRWAVAFAASPAYAARMRSDRARLILQGGISISLLLSLLIWIFLDDRARTLHAADQAIELALYDPLTGLPNRKLLEERTAQALAAARRHQVRAALLFVDLDRFKPVNDNYGHAYGDLLLKEVAQRMQGCMRESDIAARLGGDEFVVLLSETDGPETVKAVANKILDRLIQPYRIAGHTFDISASIGVAIYPDHGHDSTALMKSADAAMYAAKNRGRANVQFAAAGDGG